MLITSILLVSWKLNLFTYFLFIFSKTNECSITNFHQRSRSASISQQRLDCGSPPLTRGRFPGSYSAGHSRHNSGNSTDHLRYNNGQSDDLQLTALRRSSPPLPVKAAVTVYSRTSVTQSSLYDPSGGKLLLDVLGTNQKQCRESLL